MSDCEVEEMPPVVMNDEPNSPEGPASVSVWRAYAAPIVGIRIGVLVGIADNGNSPLVVFPGSRGSAAVRARAVIDLHGGHIGREVALMFDEGDARRPIVIGCFPGKDGWPAGCRRGQVDVDVDGERLMVSAKDQLVLQCGKATITLTKAGKVLIQGTYISSRSSGINRIKGGSVQLN